MIWTRSPVAEAVALILAAKLGDHRIACRLRGPAGESPAFPKTPRPEQNVLILSYGEDFDDLWGLDAWVPEWLGGQFKDVVLIWEETPALEAGGVEARDHLSAFDWAVALTLHRVFAAPPPSTPNEVPVPWRLRIVDLASRSHGSSSNVALFKTLQRSQPAMLPHVEWVLPADPPSFLQEFFGAANWNASSTQIPLDNVGLVRQLWAANLTRPSERRHAIANLVGPRVLLRAMNLPPLPVASHPAGGALDQLLPAVGLAGSGTKELPPWESRWRGIVERFVLVDDMHASGWSQFLCAALGAELGKELVACGGPDQPLLCGALGGSLVALLQEVGAGGAQNKLRVNGGLCLTGNDVEVLFLDLRLFTNRDPEEELNFYRTLTVLAEQAEEGTANLPWRGFAKPDLTTVRSWLANGGGDRTAPGYFIALTLLPRILAIVDPMLPIVLFSSTGRKEILDHLAGYRNIITEFDKPRFFGDSSSDVISETKRRLVRATQAALTLAKGRKALLPLRKPVKSSSPVVGVQPDNPPSFAALYIDESFSNDKLTVAGILALYPEKPNEEKFDWGAKKKDKGIHWDWGGQKKWSQKPSPSQQEQVLAAFLELAEENKVQLLGVAVTAPVKCGDLEGTEGLKLLDPEQFDNLHRTLIGVLIEASIYRILAAESRMAHNFTFSILADVRNVPPPVDSIRLKDLALLGLVPQPVYSPAKAAECLSWLEERLRNGIEWGQETLPADLGLAAAVTEYLKSNHSSLQKAKADGNFISYLPPQGVLPIMANVARRYARHPTTFRLQVNEARALFLPEGVKQARERENRSLHYWADWLAGAVREARSGQSTSLPPWAAQLVGAGFDIEYNDTLVRSLDLARRADLKERTDVLINLIRDGLPDRSDLVSSRCREALALALGEASGDEIVASAAKANL